MEKPYVVSKMIFCKLEFCQCIQNDEIVPLDELLIEPDCEDCKIFQDKKKKEG